jgi:hypothetical protein
MRGRHDPHPCLFYAIDVEARIRPDHVTTTLAMVRSVTSEELSRPSPFESKSRPLCERTSAAGNRSITETAELLAAPKAAPLSPEVERSGADAVRRDLEPVRRGRRPGRRLVGDVDGEGGGHDLGVHLGRAAGGVQRGAGEEGLLVSGHLGVGHAVQGRVHVRERAGEPMTELCRGRTAVE